MLLKTEGYHGVTIINACIGAPKFPCSDKDVNGNNRNEGIAVWGDVVITCQADDGSTGDWRGELSNRTGTGNYAQFTRTEMTLKTLQEIGFGVADWNALCEQIAEDGNIPNLVNTQATANVVAREYDGKTYHDIKYLNAGTKKLSKAELFASLQGGGFKKDQQQAPVQQTAQQAPVQQQQAPQQMQQQNLQQAPVQQQQQQAPAGGPAPVANQNAAPNPYIKPGA